MMLQSENTHRYGLYLLSKRMSAAAQITVGHPIDLIQHHFSILQDVMTSKESRLEALTKRKDAEGIRRMPYDSSCQYRYHRALEPVKVDQMCTPNPSGQPRHAHQS